MTHYTLRRDVIHYMRQHPEQFEPFVAEEEEEDDENSLMKIIVRFTIIRLFKGREERVRGCGGCGGWGGEVGIGRMCPI